jgi:2-dehydro-3-deoxyglucarate aldolase/4-hydroxy-2-oxoheptanedioate aldolase
VLDLGALGVMVPRVESRAQMEDIVAQLKYAPAGKRGVALGIAHDHYRPEGPSYFVDANAQTLVIALLETATAFEQLEEIVSVKGLDVAWMGHYDLTVSMGIPSQFDHPRFLAAMDQLLAACARHHVAPGFLVATPAEALFWIRKGFRMISMGSDIGVFMNGVGSFRKAVDEGLKSESKEYRHPGVK